MIQTYSSTIRRREMDAVLTCMVDEKIGPGELNQRLIQFAKEFFSVDGAVALRSPVIALKYAIQALDLPLDSGIMISALAPCWQYKGIISLGYKPIVLDVAPETALVTLENVEEGIRQGGRLLILSGTLGNIYDIAPFLELGVPIIEDVSQNVGAFYEFPQEEGESKKKMAGSNGVFSIMGLEENDLITGGGGAVLMAPDRREWIVLKRLVDSACRTDILPDLNSALAFVQLKEFTRNQQRRQELFAAFQKSLMSSRHKTFIRNQNGLASVYTFPVVLNSGFKDVKQYAAKKGIEIQPTFTDSVVDYLQDDLEGCINSKSLLLRCASFPLYPRLGNTQSTLIIKVLGTLP